MSLPIFQSPFQDLNMMQTRWASILEPIISKPQNNGNILMAVALINGATTINHKLGRKMQGWVIVDQDAAASIYRSKPLNDTTLTLTSDAVVNVSIEVF